MGDGDWMTTEEAADEVGMSSDWVRLQIVEGRLRATAWKTGQRHVYRIRVEDWDEFVATYSQQTDAEDWE